MAKPAMSKKRFLEKCKVLGVTNPNKVAAQVQNRCGSTKVIQFMVQNLNPMSESRFIQAVNRQWSYETDDLYEDRVGELLEKYRTWLMEHVAKEGVSE